MDGWCSLAGSTIRWFERIRRLDHFEDGTWYVKRFVSSSAMSLSTQSDMCMSMHALWCAHQQVDDHNWKVALESGWQQ